MKSFTFSLISPLNNSTCQPDDFTKAYLPAQMPTSLQHPNLWPCCPLCLEFLSTSHTPGPPVGPRLQGSASLFCAPLCNQDLWLPRAPCESRLCLIPVRRSHLFLLWASPAPTPGMYVALTTRVEKTPSHKVLITESGQLEARLEDYGCAGNHRAMYNEVLIVQGRQLGREVLSHWLCSLDNYTSGHI